MNRPSASRSRSRAAVNRSSSFAPSLRRRPTSQSLPPDPEDDPTDTQEATATHAIVEEIAEIKRYEDFTTIDWVQDAAREQLRRKARRKQRDSYSFGPGGRGAIGWRTRLYETYDAGQAWIVVTLVGAAIGLIAACLNIITEWLADIKLGHCETAFYLNENFCCWGAEGGTVGSRETSLGTLANVQQGVPNGSDGAAFGPSIMSSTSSSQRYSPLQRLLWSRALRRMLRDRASRR